MVQVLGETPGTDQRRLRLDRWAWLLLISRATVLDVALETGFENHETVAAFSAVGTSRVRELGNKGINRRAVSLPWCARWENRNWKALPAVV